MHLWKTTCLVLQLGHTAQPWRSLHMQSTGTAILLATHDTNGACLSSRAAAHFRHCLQSGRLAAERG